jgi:RNA polymerase sigma-70 factor (ECF subfamily)
LLCCSRLVLDTPVEYSPGDITALLNKLACGDQEAGTELVPMVYEELRRLAAGRLRSERPDHTLQATALVHEAYLKLTAKRHAKWQNRDQFFGVASLLMRRILVDYARSQRRVRRGGERQRVSFDEALLVSAAQSDELLAVDESLARLEKLDPRQCRIVELRYFGGLTMDEVAKVLGISAKTVMREWSMAKAWLYGDLKEHQSDGPGELDPGQDAV